MTMASISKSPPPLPCITTRSKLISRSSSPSPSPSPSPVSLSFSLYKTVPLLRIRLCALNAGSGSGSIGNEESHGFSLLRKPNIVSEKVLDTILEEEECRDEEVTFSDSDVDQWIELEDRILEETVPLVGFVRMLLHSDLYKSGDKLSIEHERTILERLLRYHPELEKKIGCGIDYITVGYHPDFEGSRCLFIVQNDGELVDFSYWKCLKGLIRENYPLCSETFIRRHFHRRRRFG